MGPDPGFQPSVLSGKQGTKVMFGSFGPPLGLDQSFRSLRAVLCYTNSPQPLGGNSSSWRLEGHGFTTFPQPGSLHCEARRTGCYGVSTLPYSEGIPEGPSKLVLQLMQRSHRRGKDLALFSEVLNQPLCPVLNSHPFILVSSLKS